MTAELCSQTLAGAETQNHHIGIHLTDNIGNHFVRFAHIPVNILAWQSRHSLDQFAVRKVLAALVRIDDMEIGFKMFGKEFAALQNPLVQCLVGIIGSLGIHCCQDTIDWRFGTFVDDNNITFGTPDQVPLGICNSGFVFG